MKLELNTERGPFLTIGEYTFSFQTPEHEVNIDELAHEFQKQILYNIHRRVLKTEDKKGYQNLLQRMQPSTPAPLENIPPKQVPEAAPDLVEEDLKTLRAILKSNVSTIKRKAAQLPMGKIRRLLAIEQKGKKRKGVISFLTGRIEKYQKEVTEKLNSEPESPGPVYDPYDPVKPSTQVSEVVESDKEEIICNIQYTGQVTDVIEE